MATKGGGEVPEEWKKVLMSMRKMVEELYYKDWPCEDEIYLVKGKDEGDGGGRSNPSSPSSCNGSNVIFSKKSSHTNNQILGHNSLLKLDVKFDLHIYDAELNAEKIGQLGQAS